MNEFLAPVAIVNAKSMTATFSGKQTGTTVPVDGTATRLKVSARLAIQVIWALATPTNTAVAVSTAAVLPNAPTYANGALGVGATLTAGSNTTLTVDGTVVNLNDRVLVKNQASTFQNGIYTCTTAGGGVPWVLTRATDCDQAAEVLADILVTTTAGSTNTGKQFLHHGAVIVMGTDPVLWEAGEPVGTWSFEMSNSSTNGTNGSWDAITFTSQPPTIQPAGSASHFTIDPLSLASAWIRPKYVPTSGTGLASVYLCGKGNS